MANHTTLMGLAALALCVVFVAPATVVAISGQATYYTEYTPSACYGYDTSQFPAGNLIAAASPDLYNNGNACGVSYSVTCTGATNGGSNPCTSNPTVKVKIVDKCPGCTEPGLDLSQEAFSKIANLDAGRININFNTV